MERPPFAVTTSLSGMKPVGLAPKAETETRPPPNAMGTGSKVIVWKGTF